MLRAARWAAALLLFAAATGRAQTPPAGTPDVPGGDGTLRGRIVNASRPAAVAGFPVLLYALPDAGPPGVREVDSDAQGRFSFTNISNDPGTVYLIGVRAGEVPFGVRVRFKAGEREKSLELPISDPTADARGVYVGAVLWQLERGCEGVHVSERHALHNPGSQVIYVPEAERGARAPLFRSTLPADARDFEGHAGAFAGGLTRNGREVVFWGPLYPGEQALEFSWALPVAPSGALPAAPLTALPSAPPEVAFSRQLDAGARQLRVRTPAAARAPRSEQLAAGRDVNADGAAWREQTAGALAPGASLALSLELAPLLASTDVAFSEARVWLELDDAALQVDEQLALTVSSAGPLTSPNGDPLLCLTLPPGATGLRFSSQALELGLALDSPDQIALRGPLPPGPTAFALRYQLPAGDDETRLSLRFPLRLPQLSVFMTDTGVRAEGPRLHRRRPFRSEDRSYMHLEAFELAAGEPVELALARLTPEPPLPVAARAGFALLLAGAAAAFLIAPLRRPSAEPAPVSREAAHAAAERESVLAALGDLEEDFATGKLDATDHAQMRGELRARAAALLAAERAARSEPVRPAAPAAPVCPGCAAPVAPDARFCSSCGARLGPRDAESRAG